MMRHARLFSGACGLLLAACGNDTSPTAQRIADLIETGRQRAQTACGASAADLESDEPATEAARCYSELAVDIDDCERRALEAFPEAADTLLDCESRDLDALVACCGRQGPCSVGGIEECYGSLWGGDSGGPCDVSEDVLDAIDADVDACEAGSAAPSKDPCAAAGSEPLAWDRAGPSGASPAAMFAKLGGACTADYAWNAALFRSSMAPESSRGTFRVEVALDTSSARVVTPRDPSSCSARVLASATATLRTDDGLLDEVIALTLDELGARADVDVGELEGEASFTPGNGVASASLSVTLMEVRDGCRGVLSYSETGQRDSGGASAATGGPLALWGF